MVDVNASIDPFEGDASWDEIEAISKARDGIADEVIEFLVGKGLTVSTAKAIIKKVNDRIDKAISDVPVAALSLRRSSPTNARTL